MGNCGESCSRAEVQDREPALLKHLKKMERGLQSLHIEEGEVDPEVFDMFSRAVADSIGLIVSLQTDPHQMQRNPDVLPNLEHQVNDIFIFHGQILGDREQLPPLEDIKKPSLSDEPLHRQLSIPVESQSCRESMGHTSPLHRRLEREVQDGVPRNLPLAPSERPLHRRLDRNADTSPRFGSYDMATCSDASERPLHRRLDRNVECFQVGQRVVHDSRGSGTVMEMLSSAASVGGSTASMGVTETILVVKFDTGREHSYREHSWHKLQVSSADSRVPIHRQIEEGKAKVSEPPAVFHERFRRFRFRLQQLMDRSMNRLGARQVHDMVARAIKIWRAHCYVDNMSRRLNSPRSHG